MSWIFYTFLAVNFFSITNVFDKYFVSKKYKSIYSFAVVINIVYLIFFAIVAFFIRNSFILNLGLLWTFIASMAYFLMWIFWWKALTTGEVSRVIAIFFTNPIFNALLAVFFLKESLSVFKWLAIILIVVGAIMSTWEGKKAKQGINRAYIFALLAALFSSIGNVLSKQAMLYWQPLTVQVVGYLVALPLFLLLLVNKQVSIEAKKTFTNFRSFLLILLRGFMGFLAICSFTLSVGAGPVSLVVALNGTQPLLILVYSTLISRFFPKYIKEEISKSVLLFKAVAILLIASGAVIISL
ncbi:EamA family transporter [Candidatus Roizmanbacteria bacterium]|nr:EamA family transporter [Candidatus Roizmanbacteria bacterium]